MSAQGQAVVVSTCMYELELQRPTALARQPRPVLLPTDCTACAETSVPHKICFLLIVKQNCTFFYLQFTKQVYSSVTQSFWVRVIHWLLSHLYEIQTLFSSDVHSF